MQRLHPDLSVQEIADVDQWRTLYAANEVRNCTACTARSEAERPVPGVGETTGILFVGRNPGAGEDKTGLPFQGPSGIILNEFLEKCGLTRADIFLTNIALCHTENDRELTQVEIRTCMRLHFLNYLKMLKPYLVVSMGAEPCKTILGVGRTKESWDKLGKRHGNLIFNKAGFWGIPCYHPGSVLYVHGDKLLAQQAALDYDAVQIRRFLSRAEYYREEIKRRLNTEVICDSA